MNDRAEVARQYLEAWHSRNPGATSLVAAGARDAARRTSYQLLADAVDESAGSVLDLACGDGPLIELLRRRAATVFGVDTNRAELAAARRRLGVNHGLIRGNAMRLPFRASSFGTVTCHFALMLLQPLEAAIEEIARVTRASGALVAVMPASPDESEANGWTPFMSAIRELVTAEALDLPDIQDDRALDPELLSELLTLGGFTVTSATTIELERRCSVAEAKTAVLLTYDPDLLSPAGQEELDRRLTAAYRGLADQRGLVSFREPVAVVVARKDT